MLQSRTATEADFQSVLKLKRQVHAPHVQHAPSYFRAVTDPLTQEEFDSGFKSKGASVHLLLEDDRVVAYAFLQEIEVKGNRLLQDHKKLFVNDVCVDERCRRKGYGSKLMKAIEVVAVSSGCSLIELNVWEWNQAAVRFYEAVGLRPTMVRMCKRTSGRPLVVDPGVADDPLEGSKVNRSGT